MINRASESQTTARGRITVADVRASTNQAGGGIPFFVNWFARPISNYWTPLFFNLGWSANAVTLIRSIISCGVLISLGTGLPEMQLGSAIAVYLIYILDCVDGNLARLNDSASYWGKFVDGLGDSLYVMLAPVAVGIGLWRSDNDGLALMVGALTTALALFTEAARNRISFFCEWMVTETGPLTNQDETNRMIPRKVERAAAGILLNWLFFTPLLLLVPGGASYYLFAIALVQLPISALWLTAIILHASAILRRGRKSIHATASRFSRPRS